MQIAVDKTMSAGWIIVKQTGSPIRRHWSQGASLRGLGLSRIGRFAILPDTPQTHGMIAKVRHLVRILEGPLVGEVTPDMKAQLETLVRFNRRVDRLEQSGFWKRYEEEEPQVASSMKNMSIRQTGTNTFEMIGTIYSAIENFSQDEINAFVLDYRQVTQDNDPISIGNLSKLYAQPWMPKGARNSFEEARKKLNRQRDRTSIISFGNDPLQMRDLIDTVVYGGLAHANPEKAARFESWEQSGIMGIIWAEFFAYLRGFMDMLKFFRRLNGQVLAMAGPPSAGN
jgi:ribosomal protein L30